MSSFEQPPFSREDEPALAQERTPADEPTPPPEVEPVSASMESPPDPRHGSLSPESPAPFAAGAPNRFGLLGRARRSVLGPLFAVALIAGVASSGATYALVTATATGRPATAAASTTTGSSAQLLTSSTGSIVAAYEKAKASVVTIDVTESSGRLGQTVSGVGTGIIVGSNGVILTNNHVVDGATSVHVTLPDGRTVAGSVYGTSSTTDLAIVKVAATGLTAASLGNSASLAVGETVLAVGNPLGEFTDSVTAGIVSGLDRSVSVGTENLTGLIQTDAAVNGGNSGGPLVDTNGNVVGVVTAGSSTAQGIGFAIPIAAAASMISAALAGQTVS